jgi:hypothetical protein
MRNIIVQYYADGLINDFRGLSAPQEDVLNARYAAVERIKFELDAKYRLHPNNFVKHYTTIQK